jgi:glycosyltransferase involved in cell wall biosynthesis
MIRAMLLNMWAGIIARLFLSGRNFRILLFYSPAFAFFRRFLGRDIFWAYDKADAYNFFYRGAVGDAIALLDRYDTTRADIVLASSHQLDVLARRQGAKRTSRVDNGIYGRDFKAHPPRDKMLAVYVGNLAQDIWGVDMLLQAVPKISKDFPSFHVNIVGEGPLKQEYESVCRRLGIANRTKFEGHVPHDEVSNVISSARVAVAPYKSFPGFRFSSSLKILEYLASGTPVVVSNVGPFADLIQTNRVGLTVDPTPEKIGEGICSIFRLDDEKWEAMSKRAVSLAHEYEWDAVLSRAFDEIEKAYANVASGNKGL